jgi:AcrB/AcrD/AcrF family
VLGIKTLPIAQFPDIAPPTVVVMISYRGASANVLVETALIPLEQSINGVQNMRFITSSATSAGEAAIIIYFEPGTDPVIRQNLVDRGVQRSEDRGPSARGRGDGVRLGLPQDLADRVSRTIKLERESLDGHTVATGAPNGSVFVHRKHSFASVRVSASMTECSL